MKLVAEARRTAGDRVIASVGLRELELGDPLAALDGQGNALEIDSWPAGRIVITQRDGGLEKTAYALVSDLMKLGDGSLFHKKQTFGDGSDFHKNRGSGDRPLGDNGADDSGDHGGAVGAPLTGITIVDLSRVLAGPLLHDARGRHGRSGYQG